MGPFTHAPKVVYLTANHVPCSDGMTLSAMLPDHMTMGTNGAPSHSTSSRRSRGLRSPRPTQHGCSDVGRAERAPGSLSVAGGRSTSHTGCLSGRPGVGHAAPAPWSLGICSTMRKQSAFRGLAILPRYCQPKYQSISLVPA